MLRRLRAFAFTHSCALLARAMKAEREGHSALARHLQYRSRVWFERDLLLSGLSSWREYRAEIRRAKSNRRSLDACRTQDRRSGEGLPSPGSSPLPFTRSAP
jgi:hypothetical protein